MWTALLRTGSNFYRTPVQIGYRQISPGFIVLPLQQKLDSFYKINMQTKLFSKLDISITDSDIILRDICVLFYCFSAAQAALYHTYSTPITHIFPMSAFVFVWKGIGAFLFRRTKRTSCSDTRYWRKAEEERERGGGIFFYRYCVYSKCASDALYPKSRIPISTV